MRTSLLSSSLLLSGAVLATTVVVFSSEVLAAPTWTAVAPMAVARYRFHAVSLVSGKVLIVGGHIGTGFTNTAALFSNGSNGDTCAQATECQSGFCIDGVCCSSACGACQLCNAPGFVGTCSLAPATTVCRVSAGDCDVAESCTGTAAACPSDGFAAMGTMCRSAMGPCDAPESCTGTEAVCPVDLPLPISTICRASTGACDAEENCNGISMACPVDGFLVAGTVCRPAANGCDVAEACMGSVVTCPADLFQSDGILCDDGNVCSPVDSCQGGVCAPGTVIDCSAQDECQNDGACNPATGACLSPPPKADGTACPDGTCQSGTCTPVTSGSGSGTGSGTGSGSGSGSSSSSGGIDPGTESGCSCRVAGGSDSEKWPWLLGITLFAVRRARRWRIR